MVVEEGDSAVAVKRDERDVEGGGDSGVGEIKSGELKRDGVDDEPEIGEGELRRRMASMAVHQWLGRREEGGEERSYSAVLGQKKMHKWRGVLSTGGGVLITLGGVFMSNGGVFCGLVCGRAPPLCSVDGNPPMVREECEREEESRM